MRYYQNLIDLFKNLRDDNKNPKEVIQNLEKFFDLREKIIMIMIFFLEIILFCYLKLNTKQNMEKDSK